MKLVWISNGSLMEARDWSEERRLRKRRILRMTVLPLPPASGTVFVEASMQGPVVCMQCERTESQCNCEKYCTICKGQHNVRLCADGLYYCPDCRDACDVPLANASGK